MSYTVYILRTSSNTFYTGQTNNLEKRLGDHKKGKGSKYIRIFKSFNLVYKESKKTLSLALKREAEIKKLPHEEKEILIRLTNGHSRKNRSSPTS